MNRPLPRTARDPRALRLPMTAGKAGAPCARLLRAALSLALLIGGPGACRAAPGPSAAAAFPTTSAAGAPPAPPTATAPTTTAAPPTAAPPTAAAPMAATAALASTAPTATITAPPAPCSPDLCLITGAAFLQRPIAAPANPQWDTTYPFGSTQSGMRDPHHGVEFLNAYATPVLAAGEGEVVVAGGDQDPTSPHGAWPITFYGPYMNFYGSLVVIRHQPPAALLAAYPDTPTPFFTLYGHLSQIAVQVGQHVQAGQEIGKVGQAGIATGPHLHFEVRLGENSYKASRNPVVWLQDPPGSANPAAGALLGNFIDSYGNNLEIESIVLQRLPQGDGGPVDYVTTVRSYEEKALRGLPPFYDSFGAANLPPGLYRLTFAMQGLRQELVEVLPGGLTIVSFH